MPQINGFWNGKRYLFYGYSRKKGLGREIYDKVSATGIELLPIRDDVEEIDGVKMFANPSAVEGEVDGVFIAVSPPSALDLLTELKEAGYNRVFFQIGASDPNVIEKAKELEMEYESGCALMRFDKMGFPHSTHRLVSKLFGKIK